MADGVDGADGA
jgi:hypothetical protein